MTDVANCGGCNVTCSFPFATATCIERRVQAGRLPAGLLRSQPERPRLRDRLREVERRRRDLRRPGQRLRRRRRQQPDGGPARLQDDGRLRGRARRRAWARRAGSASTRRPTRTSRTRRRAATASTTTATAASTSRSRSARRCTVGSGACANPNGMWVCDNSMTGGHRCNGSPKTARHRGLQRPRRRLRRQGRRARLGVEQDQRRQAGLPRRPERHDVRLRGEPATTRRRPTTASTRPAGPARSPGRQPWSNVTKEEAEAACEKIGTGWRLCTAGRMARRLQRLRQHDLPVRQHLQRHTTCNGWDYTKTAGVTTMATGAATMCVSEQSTTAGDELYDMSGNVKEWVAVDDDHDRAVRDARRRLQHRQLHGRHDDARAPGLQCDALDSGARRPPSGSRRSGSVAACPGQLPP